MTEVAERIRVAKARLATPDRWCQHAYRTESGAMCVWNALAVVPTSFAVLGGSAENAAHRFVAGVAGYADLPSLCHFNNRSTFEQVHDLLDRALIAASEKEGVHV